MTVGITELPPEGMQLGGVALAGDADRGTRTTEGLSLLFTTDGITVQGPQPQIERLLAWSGLDSAACHEKIVLPDGRDAAIMELTSGGQSIRFLLPTDTVSPGQAAYLDQALPAWLARYRGAAETSRPEAAAAEAPVLGPDPSEAVARPAAEEAATGAPMAAAVGAAVGGAAAATAGEAGATGAPATSAPNGSTAPPPPPGVTGFTPTAPPSPAEAAPTAGEPAPTGAPPPPPGVTGFTPAASPAQGSGPPPPPPAAVAGAVDAAAPASPTAWDNPPLGQPEIEIAPPAKKARSSFRRRKPEPEGATEATDGPPTAAPAEPVALGVDLPPPTDAVDAFFGPGAASTVDRLAGASAPEVAPEAEGTPAKKRRNWGRRAKTAAVTGAGAGIAADASTATAAPAGVGAGEPGVGTPEPGTPDGTPPPPTAGIEPPAAAGAGPALATEGTAAAAHDVRLADAGAKGNRSRLTVLLVVLLVLVLGGIGYFVAKRGSSTTPATTAGTTAVTPGVADAALAASVNLRLADLPTGWTPAAPAAAVVRPPAATPAAQATAGRSLAACVGAPYATVEGLFGTGSLPGQTAMAASPTFQGPAGALFQMSSRTITLATPAQVQTVGSVFANTNLATCLGQYEAALVAAAVPGATAQVQQVSLGAPAGVATAGFVTTYAVPSVGTEVVGQAFVLGGRLVSVLEPTTGGVPIPTGVFTPAFEAVAGRVAAAVGK